MSDESSSDDEDYQSVERTFHLVYNWLMTGDSAALQPFCKKINYAAVKFSPDIQVVVAPPVPYLMKMKKLLKQKIGVCSQNCCHEEEGAFTGDVSASMLRSVKAAGVICGHWERRRRCGEEPGLVALQVQRATEHKLIAYLCFGESVQERRSGRTMEVIKSQISGLFELPIDWRKVVLIYEPVWSFKDEDLVACEVEFPVEEEEVVEEGEPGQNDNAAQEGEGRNKSREDSTEVFDDEKFSVIIPPKCQHIDDLLGDVRFWLGNHASKKIAWTTPILYGGHVTAQDGPEFAKMNNIDGLLVHPKSMILDDIVEEDVGEQAAEDEVEDFIELIRRCGEERREDENLNQVMFKPSKKKKTKKKGKK